MHKYKFAPRQTHTAVTDTATTIVNGDSVFVYGLVITNGGTTDNVEVTFQTDESTPATLIIVELNQKHCYVHDARFIADKGLQIVSSVDDNITVTVLHSNPGV